MQYLKQNFPKQYESLLEYGKNNELNNVLADYIEKQVKSKMFIRAADIGSAARNSPIQGTQADAMKEAIVFVDYKRRIYNLDIELKGIVHDEFHYDFPEYYVNKTTNIPTMIPEWTKTIGTLYLNGYTEMGYDSHINSFWEK